MAAISGAADELRGLKENVIVGSVIPAGTGAPMFSNLVLEAEKAEAELLEKERESGHLDKPVAKES